METGSHGFLPHHFTLTSPVLSSVPVLSLFSQASGFLCSFCDYRTFIRVSPRHTPHVTLLSMATLPEARCSLRLELENHCDTSPTTLSLLQSLTVMEETLRSLSCVEEAIQQCKNTPTEPSVSKMKEVVQYFILHYQIVVNVSVFKQYFIAS